MEPFDMLRRIFKRRNSSSAEECVLEIVTSPSTFQMREASNKTLKAHNIDFGRCDLSEVNLRNADLSGSDLSKTIGLLPSQLAGANLLRTKLPADIDFAAAFENIKELSKNAGALHLATNLACGFVLLTVAGTKDIQLLTNSGTAKLPVIDISVPTGIFFSIAPIALACQYLITHLYLQRLWTLFGSLPAIFPDGVTLDRKSYPWLLNDMIRLVLPKLKPLRQSVGKVQLLAFSIITYGLVPLTLAVIYLRCLFTRDIGLLGIQGLMIVLVVSWGWHSVYAARRELAGWSLEQPWKIKRHYIAKTATSLILAYCLLNINYSLAAQWSWSNPEVGSASPNVLGRFIGVLLNFQSVFKDRGDIAEDVTFQPSDWVDSDSKPKLQNRPSFANRDSRRNLFGLDAKGAFLVNADLRRTDLRHADFSEADLRGAKTYYASSLRGIPRNKESLNDKIAPGGTTFQGAKFYFTRMDYGDFSHGDFQGSEFDNAQLKFANLSHAYFKDVTFMQCTFKSNEFVDTKFLGTTFHSSTLIDVQFYNTDFSGATFVECSFEGSLPGEEVFYNVRLLQGQFGRKYYELSEIEGSREKSPDGRPAFRSFEVSPDHHVLIAQVQMFQAAVGMSPPHVHAGAHVAAAQYFDALRQSFTIHVRA